MLQQNTAVHHHESACLSRLLGGLLVNHTFLHPDCWNFQPNRLVHDFFDEFRPPENVHDIDLLRNVQQRCIRLFPQRRLDLRIDGNDAVPLALHVESNAVAGTVRLVGESNYGNGLGASQQFSNRVALQTELQEIVSTSYSLSPASACTSSLPAYEPSPRPLCW